ncbi:hypothetical protein EV361DRAFT_783537, partial [Lentinula raphanica]
IIHGSQTDKDKSRLLMTKMVNLLSTKLELGSPMICMYLLQNPDHYSSHTFVPFYWNTFVTEARKYWYPNIESEDTRVLLIKHKNKYVGLSSTFDYMYRPKDHEHINLYDWVSTFTRVKRYNRKNKSPDDNMFDSSGYNNCLPDNIPNSDQYSFLNDHPLSSTHRVQKYRNSHYIVPNFIGPPLPRSDRDDREYYCCTMLTLFKPWRTGADLKNVSDSWHESFTTYQFSSSAELYMKNMNLRYECLDSRDDFRSQLRSGNTSLLANSVPFDLDSIRDQLHYSLHTSQIPSDFEIIDNENDDAIVLYDPNTGMQKGKLYMARERAMKVMHDILFSIGWTKSVSTNLHNLYPATDFNSFATFEIPKRTPDDWNNLIKLMRQEILLQRKYNSNIENKHTSSTDNDQSDKFNQYGFKPNVVEICDKHYFERLGIEHVSMKKGIDDIVAEFKLNQEQERAFRIIAHHSVGSCSDSLKMYIGGMGGTGKSQVVKAVLQLFTLQNRRYAVVVVAPTGNAASLLGGST